MKRIAAMVLNDLGQLLPHTCQSTMSECEEKADVSLAGWSSMKNLGAHVVQVEIKTVDETLPSKNGMDEQIKKFINDYLNQMPSLSRVTMEDLSFYVHRETKFNQRAAYELVREVVSIRTDFVVNKGRGCCKK